MHFLIVPSSCKEKWLYYRKQINRSEIRVISAFARGDGDGVSVDLNGDRHALDAFIAVGNGEGAVVNGKGIITENGIIPTTEGKGSGDDAHCPSSMEAVIDVVNGEGAAVDGKTTFGLAPFVEMVTESQEAVFPLS